MHGHGSMQSLVFPPDDAWEGEQGAILCCPEREYYRAETFCKESRVPGGACLQEGDVLLACTVVVYSPPEVLVACDLLGLRIGRLGQCVVQRHHLHRTPYHYSFTVHTQTSTWRTPMHCPRPMCAPGSTSISRVQKIHPIYQQDCFHPQEPSRRKFGLREP